MPRPLQLIYENSYQERVEFGKNGIYINQSPLFDYKWSPSVTHDKITGFDYEPKEFPITVNFIGDDAKEKANDFHAIIEKDIDRVVTGKLIVGDYSLDGYFTASSKDNYKDADFKITQNYTFVARQMWKKESTFYFTEIDLSGLDYEHDTPYDYSTPIIESIINPHFKDVDFILRIYGEAYTPSVMINNNVYEVDVDLAEGEFLEINSANKTIIKRNIYGVDINQFSNRNRDYYIFQKIAPGYNTIVWDGSFSFTITLLEERSEPVWI